jgi:enoyl reductase-like protein
MLSKKTLDSDSGEYSTEGTTGRRVKKPKIDKQEELKKLMMEVQASSNDALEKQTDKIVQAFQSFADQYFAHLSKQ